MKRYFINLHQWYEWHSEEPYTELLVVAADEGEWVKAHDALKLQHRIDRMQKRLDKLEGRTK